MRIRSRIITALLACFGFVLIWNDATAQNIIFVDRTAAGADNGASWDDAFVFLQDALAEAQPGDEIWVAAGTYNPDQGRGVVAGDREASFLIREEVSLYGGFLGNESTRDQRNFSTNETILSGDLLNNDVGIISADEPTRLDNSVHVITIRDTVEPAILDGFKISDGHAIDPPSSVASGGGMLVRSPAILRNLTISRSVAEEGGGAKITSSSSGPGRQYLSQIRFENNFASEEGGGLFLASQSITADSLQFHYNTAPNGLGGGVINLGNATFNKCVFIGNTAVDGGAIYSSHVAITLIANSILVANEALFGGGIHVHTDNSIGLLSVINSLVIGNIGQQGGGIYSLNGPLEVINSTISHNKSTKRGGGIFQKILDAEVRFRNTIIWGNSTNGDFSQLYYELEPGGTGSGKVANGIVEGTIPDGMSDDGLTLNQDPLFADPDGQDQIQGTLDDDYRLTTGSPAIDSGNNAWLPPDSLDFDRDGKLMELLPIDIEYLQRAFTMGSNEGIVDIGAHEFDAPPVSLELEENTELPPQSIQLSPVFPNPASNLATITYKSDRPEKVAVIIYDILGRRRRVLIRRTMSPGILFSDTISLAEYPAGVYFIRLEGEFSSPTRKLIIHR